MVGRFGLVKQGDLSGQDETTREKKWCWADHPKTAWPQVRIGAERSEPPDATRETIARQESEHS